MKTLLIPSAWAFSCLPFFVCSFCTGREIVGRETGSLRALKKRKERERKVEAGERKSISYVYFQSCWLPDDWGMVLPLVGVFLSFIAFLFPRRFYFKHLPHFTSFSSVCETRNLLFRRKRRCKMYKIQKTNYFSNSYIFPSYKILLFLLSEL